MVQPANDALKELKGCIAPVRFFPVPEREANRGLFFLKLKLLVYAALDKNEPVFLNITTAKIGNGEIAVVENFYIMNIMQKAAAPAMKFLKSCAI